MDDVVAEEKVVGAVEGIGLIAGGGHVGQFGGKPDTTLGTRRRRRKADGRWSRRRGEEEVCT
jgi:hypothetical protein